MNHLIWVNLASMVFTFKSTFQQLTTRQTILGYTLFSLLLAWRLIYIEQGWVNDDFVLYHEVARLFSAGEFKAGYKLYNWPFYSSLISLVHVTMGTSLLLSAQLITGLLFGMTSYSFLSLIRLAGGNKLTVFAGAMILFSSNYIAGDVIAMLLRDPGFWAFFLASLIFIIKFCQQSSLKNALLWQICALVAILFRIEGVTFLVFLPFIILFTHFPDTIRRKTLHHRMAMLLKANSLNIFLLLVLLVLFAINPSISINDLGRLQEVVNLFDSKIADMVSVLALRSDLLAINVLNGQFDEYAMYGLIFALTGIAFLKVFSALGIFNLGLAGYFFVGQSATIHSQAKRILIFAALLALVNIILILFNVMLLSTRYVVPFVLIIFVFAAFSLASLLENFSKIRLRKNDLAFFSRYELKHWLTILILLAILISFIGNILPKRASSHFEQEAVAYMLHKQIPNEKVFFVSPRARLYAGARYVERGYDYWEYTQKAISNQSIYQYDYLLINIHVDDNYADRKKILDANLTHYELEKEFYGFKNKKKVMFYRKKIIQ